MVDIPTVVKLKHYCNIKKASAFNTQNFADITSKILLKHSFNLKLPKVSKYTLRSSVKEIKDCIKLSALQFGEIPSFWHEFLASSRPYKIFL